MCEGIAMAPQIMVVDDEANVRELVCDALRIAEFETLQANDGMSALTLLRTNKPDLLIIDINMPLMDGFDLVERLRSQNDMTPVLMLSARNDRADITRGLSLGADDYVTKPYSSRELVARIKAVLRRGQSEDGSNQDQDLLEVGPIRLNIGKHQVFVSGNPVALPLKEFELLEFLMRNSGRVLTRSQLIDRVWGGDYYGDTKTLDVHIKRLRAKVEADPANPVLIQTIRGLGYKLENA